MNRWQCLAAVCGALWAAHASAQPAGCTTAAGPGCYRAFQPPGAGGKLNYYASMDPGDAAGSAPAGQPAPTRALVAMHGHPRDADKTFDAALLAVRNADALADTLVVAPVFQVAADKAGRCSTPGVPAARAALLGR
jgi:hypothetical protein